MAKVKRPAAKKARTKAKVALLSGSNPQIAMADGDAPVQAYIAAVPGWKQAVCRRIDALIVKTIPKVQKTVKWNTPMYGVGGKGYFLGFHMFTHYVKVTFFEGASLQPVPPGSSKTKRARHLDIHEGDQLNEAQFAKWIKQAAKLPGFLAPH